MRVLLTGQKATLVPLPDPILNTHGHEVVGLDTDLFAGCDFGEQPEIPEVIKDVRDLTQADIEGFDAVVHPAALSNDPLGDLDARVTYEINHQASVRLAELAKRARVARFVFFSSCSTYGAAGDAFLDELPTQPSHGLCGIEGHGRSATSPYWRTIISAQPICEMRRHMEHLRGCGWTSFSTI